jgi:hypothetical protein
LWPAAIFSGGHVRGRLILALVVACTLSLVTAAPSLAATPFSVAPGQTDMGVDPVDPAASNPAGAGVDLRSVGGLLGLGVLTGQQRLAEGLPFTFAANAYAIRTLTPGQLPFFGPTIIPLVDPEVHDETGVRMKYEADGLLYDHVCAQANYGLDNLNAYRLTRNGAYLARAKLQAQRLIDRHVDVGSAWFHPYDFFFGSEQPPWYSALSQGQALILFTRLFEATHDPLYQTAAQGTFASFLIKGPVDGPWVVDVDATNHLWLEEYPGPHPDFTFNGHMFAALDLYDYYRVFGDERALELFRGATTTAADYAAAYRQGGRRSLYCLAHKTTASPAYHEAHVQEFLNLFKITGDPRFARLADNFENDAARDRADGFITVGPGTYSIVRLAGAGGTVVQRKVLVTKTAMHLHVSVRRRVANTSGYWLKIDRGAFSTFWIRESAPRVYFPGQLVRLDYVPTRALICPTAGVRTLHMYAANGAVVATRTMSLAKNVTLQVSARAIVNGRTQVLVASGPGRGYWIDLAGLTLV